MRIFNQKILVTGGAGFIGSNLVKTLVEKGYRDSRINRIFEGTNEINRMLVVDTAMKRAMKGDFDLFGEAQKVTDSLKSLKSSDKKNEEYFAEKKAYIKNFKKAILATINKASEKFQRKLAFEQEILFSISDMIMVLYV